MADKNDDNNKKKREDDKNIQDLLKELENMGVDLEQEKIKMIQLGPKKSSLRAKILQIIVTVILNFIIFLSLSGYIAWANFNSIWDLLLFAAIFSGIEFVLVLLVWKLIPKKYITLSFGSILFLPTMIAFIGTVVLEIGAEPINASAAIVFFFVFAIIRSFFKNTYSKYIFRKKYQKFRSNKGDKK